MIVHPSHATPADRAAGAEAVFKADIAKDFPRQWGRLAWAAGACGCDRHWYGNPRVGIIEYLPIFWRLWWRTT